MITLPTQCESCKHYRPEAKGYTCSAYPACPGIPREIIDGEHDHRDPYPGDNGIRWEPKAPGIVHPKDEP